MKLNDAAIVTVRSSSTRLPNKATMKIKGDLRAIDIVVERAKKTKLPVIIATSTSNDDDVFIDIAREHNVHIFRGSLLNKIKRWNDCFNQYGISYGLVVDGDDLAFNYEIGSRAVEQLKSSPFDMVTNTEDIVTGFFSFAMTKDAVEKIYQIVPDEKTNTDVPTKYIEKANLRISQVKLYDYERNKPIRLTLDYEEDLKFFRSLYEKIDILENGKSIVDFLEKNPDISKINYHRQTDFLKNQAKFNEGVKFE
ncbi:MAG: acylneuraminate cytidylyltransferase [Thaumarchaeota archaeon]|nr:acylneuraminate cytidylyltransferase [Nitrososphaerota archaeon]